MATPEWVSTDNEIWDFDFSDDFIWIPSFDMYGLGRWVAKSEYFQYVANKVPFQFVAKKE